MSTSGSMTNTQTILDMLLSSPQVLVFQICSILCSPLMWKTKFRNPYKSKRYSFPCTRNQSIQPLTAGGGRLHFSVSFMYNVPIIWTKRDNTMKYVALCGVKTHCATCLLKSSPSVVDAYVYKILRWRRPFLYFLSLKCYILVNTAL